MNLFLGLCASSGLCIGQAFVIPDTQERVIPQEKITESQKNFQWTNLQDAVGVVLKTVETDLAFAKNTNNKKQQKILEVYSLMLQDSVFFEQLRQEFWAGDNNIILTLFNRMQEDADNLQKSGNEYLAERACDITDVFGKVLDTMLGIKHFDISTVTQGSIVVATKLSASDVLTLTKKDIKGLCLTQGGVTSHIAILARSYSIPAVFDLKKVVQHIKTGQTLIIDADKDLVIVDPDEQNLLEYNTKIAQNQKQSIELKAYTNKKATTKDGLPFEIFANIGSVEEAQKAFDMGADGIGLFRTEFLFMSRQQGQSPHIFSEEKQFQIYKKVLQIMKDKPVTIRTLDSGADKIITQEDFEGVSIEANPLLGLRAIRLSLAHPSQLKAQLRSLYRASIYGNLRIMLPLVTSCSQVIKVQEMIAQIKKELQQDNVPFCPDIPLGVMIETPASAVTADLFAQCSDFFSIGTNDLTQYTLGVDRENASVAYMYDEHNPAVLRLIEHINKTAQKQNLPLCVCGEMAGNETSCLVLAGLGIRHFSMNASQMPKIKKALSQYTLQELKDMTQLL